MVNRVAGEKEKNMIIYYDSKTGNVKRFAEKIALLKPDWTISDIRQAPLGRGHLVTYTAANGGIPGTTLKFLENNSKDIKSVSVSGNRNWGSRFANAATEISEKFNIPIALKFELSGFDIDVKRFIKYISKSEKQLK